MYQFIPLNSCNYLKKISININVETDEDKSRNEIWHWTNDETGAAVQSWLWVRLNTWLDRAVGSEKKNPFKKILSKKSID